MSDKYAWAAFMFVVLIQNITIGWLLWLLTQNQGVSP